MLSLLLSVGVAFASLPVLDKLKQNGFHCEEKPTGQLCTLVAVQAPGFVYPQGLAVLVPAGVTQPRRLLLHLHGHSGVCEAPTVSPEVMAGEFNFLRQIRDAGDRPDVMVFPMSAGTCTTYEQNLVPQFPAFLKWIRVLLAPKTERWILSGHSGAGRIMGLLLGNNPEFAKTVDAALLLDATYNMPEHLADWKAAQRARPSLVIESIFTDGAGTKDGSLLMKAALAHVSTGHALTHIHCKVPFEYGLLLKKVSQSGP